MFHIDFVEFDAFVLANVMWVDVFTNFNQSAAIALSVGGSPKKRMVNGCTGVWNLYKSKYNI